MQREQTQEILKTYTAEALVNSVLEFCQAYKYSFAAWQKPASKTINLIIDFSSGECIKNVNIENSPAGFIFSPFSIARDKLFLKTDIFIQLGDELKVEANNSANVDKLINYLDQISEESPSPNELSNDSSDGQSFKSLVNLSIEKIRKGVFVKVVPTRQRTLNTKGQPNSGRHFIQLAETYTNAFVSIVYTPTTKIWIGATPELLISTEGNLFKTVALAGTQLYDNSKLLADIAWTQKEIEEQALVSRFIINCFKKIRLREFDENGPKTVRAGNLIHLKTEFLVNMQETNFPELGTTMLDLLHPTSAVCGMPMETAYDFLQKHENYDREYFSGYLGPINIDDSTNLFVNLRCMKVENNEITIYAGAGVTEDSNPEKEWIETEMKMNTLLNIISKP